MFRGYRGLAIASSGLALLIALFAGAYFGSLYAPDNRNSQTVGTDSGQSEPRIRPKNGLTDVSGIDSLAERIIAQPRPDSTDQREQRDLAAQESMAVFTYWMFGAMMLQTLLAGGALIALVKDLRQNRKSAELQLRAYIKIEPAGGTVRIDRKVVFFFTLKNYGQTPAVDMAFMGSVVVRGLDWSWDKEPRPNPDEKTRPAITLHPNDPMTVHVEMDKPLPKNVYLAVKNGKAVVFGQGYIFYKDTFGFEHETVACFEFSGHDCFKTGKLRVAPNGSKAT